jgi:hypothetical protein
MCAPPPHASQIYSRAWPVPKRTPLWIKTKKCIDNTTRIGDTITMKRNTRTAERDAKTTSADTPPADYPIRRASLPEEMRRQLSRWALEKMETDLGAAREIGVPISVFMNARMGKVLSTRYLWKISQFIAQIDCAGGQGANRCGPAAPEKRE